MNGPVLAGLETGGTTCAVAVGTGPDDVEVVRFPTSGPDATVRTAVERIRGLVGARRPAAVGASCFGPLDLDRRSATFGHVLPTPKPGWAGFDVVGQLGRALDVPVAIDTDVNGAAIAEQRWGASVDADPCVYVTVGTGIGGGVVVDGRPLHGHLHPEVGHLAVRRHPDDRFAGVCPFHGDCLEGLASGPAVAARWERPAEDLADAQHDAVEIEAWYLAQLVVALTSIVSPRRIVLGGGVMGMVGLLDAARDQTAELLGGYLTPPDGYLVRPGLGDRSGVLGAIALAADLAGS